MRFFGYALGETSEPIADTQHGIRDKLHKWGFELNEPSVVTSDVEKLLEFYREIGERRAGLPYDIDGVVYKVNRVDLQRRLGDVQRAPRWAWRINSRLNVQPRCSRKSTSKSAAPGR